VPKAVQEAPGLQLIYPSGQFPDAPQTTDCYLGICQFEQINRKPVF
jgi:hypothetical protein